MTRERWKLLICIKAIIHLKKVTIESWDEIYWLSHRLRGVRKESSNIFLLKKGVEMDF